MNNLMTLNNIYNEIIIEQQEENSNSFENKEIELEFSNNLASEFTQTVNRFTKICAKMVRNRSVDKDLYDKFDDTISKIKNLVDAAKNS